MADTFFGDNDMGKIMIVQESVKNRDNAIALKSLLFLSDNGTALQVRRGPAGLVVRSLH